MNDWFKPWGDCVQHISTADGKINEVATLNCLPAIFSNLLSALLAFAGLTALIMFIMAGYKFMKSIGGGDPKNATGAGANFKYGIIGLVIVMFSFLIINIISTVTGVTCVSDFAHFGFLVCQ
jgi:hypothetical protein